MARRLVCRLCCLQSTPQLKRATKCFSPGLQRFCPSLVGQIPDHCFRSDLPMGPLWRSRGPARHPHSKESMKAAGNSGHTDLKSVLQSHLLTFCRFQQTTRPRLEERDWEISHTSREKIKRELNFYLPGFRIEPQRT